MGPASRAVVLLLLVLPAASLSGCFLFGTPSEGATDDPADGAEAFSAGALRVTRDVRLDLTGLPSGSTALDVIRDRLLVRYTLHAGSAGLPTAGLSVVYLNASGGLVTLPLAPLVGPLLRANATLALPDADPFTNVALTEGQEVLYRREVYDPSPTGGRFTGLGFSGTPGTLAYDLTIATKGARFLFNSTLPNADAGPEYDSVGEAITLREEGSATLTYAGAAPGNLTYERRLATVPTGTSALLFAMEDASPEGALSAGIEVSRLALATDFTAALDPADSGRLKRLAILAGTTRTDADVTAWYTGPFDGDAPPPCNGATREDRCRLDGLYTPTNGTSILPSTTRLAPATYANPQGTDSLLTMLLGRNVIPGDRVALRLVHPATGASPARAYTHDLRVHAPEKVTVPAGTFDALRVTWKETGGDTEATRTVWMTPGTHRLVKVERAGPASTNAVGGDTLLSRLSVLGTPGSADSRLHANLTRIEGAPAQSPGLALLLAAGLEGAPGLHAPFLSLDTLLRAAAPLAGLPPGPPGRPEVHLEFAGRVGGVASYRVAGAPEGYRYRDVEASLDGHLLVYTPGSASGDTGVWVASRGDSALDRESPIQVGDQVRLRPALAHDVAGMRFVLSNAASGSTLFVDDAVP